jgi:hypothetical protein
MISCALRDCRIPAAKRPWLSSWSITNGLFLSVDVCRKPTVSRPLHAAGITFSFPCSIPVDWQAGLEQGRQDKATDVKLENRSVYSHSFVARGDVEMRLGDGHVEPQQR